MYAELQAFYRETLRKNGLLSPLSLSYNSRDSQLARFDVFLPFLDKKNPATILDVGCGLGDLYGYLQLKGFSKLAYTGIDVVPEMISGAQKKFPAATFKVQDVLKDQLAQYDYVVCSGALNIIFESRETQFWQITAAVKNMFLASKALCSFNLLTDEQEQFYEADSRFFYSNKQKMTAFVRTLTSNYQLIENYLPHDFTLILKK